jgi:tetratricopeptide (TPR) repeat protein
VPPWGTTIHHSEARKDQAKKARAALDAFEEVCEIEHTSYLPHWGLGLVHEQKSMPEQAIASFRKAADLSRRMPFVLAALGHTLGKIGRNQEALALAEGLRLLSDERYVPAVDLAMIFIGLSDLPRAFDFLQKAAHARCAGLLLLQVDPRVKALMADQKFQAVLLTIA